MDLMVAATYDNIMMVEGEMQEVSEQDLLAAMKAAHEAIKVHCKAQMELMEEVGSTVKREYCHEENDEDCAKLYAKLVTIKHTPSLLQETETSMNVRMLLTPSAMNSKLNIQKKNWKKKVH